MAATPIEGRELAWPIYTIDFEASSLDAGTYPIEVGVCRWLAPNEAIEGWSTLIKPLPAWRDNGSWSPASQAVHGIPAEELAAGMEPTEATIALNAILGNAAAFCDGIPHDLHWAQMLARASGVRATFKLGDFDMLTARFDESAMRRLVFWLDRTRPRHRARDDAEMLMRALARGLGVEPGKSRDIEIDARMLPEF